MADSRRAGSARSSSSIQIRGSARASATPSQLASASAAAAVSQSAPPAALSAPPPSAEPPSSPAPSCMSAVRRRLPACAESASSTIERTSVSGESTDACPDTLPPPPPPSLPASATGPPRAASPSIAVIRPRRCPRNGSGSRSRQLAVSSAHASPASRVSRPSSPAPAPSLASAARAKTRTAELSRSSERISCECCAAPWRARTTGSSADVSSCRLIMSSASSWSTNAHTICTRARARAPACNAQERLVIGLSERAGGHVRRAPHAGTSGLGARPGYTRVHARTSWDTCIASAPNGSGSLRRANSA